mmetsp:Transcript_22944/g.39326  ORF Transcript_22944/g.39326 Transcript_22944/m.39326 type:complete len:604 (+) Transcript_22944:111-1922(+)|eukprot:CAMPEP_0196663312 /NCGR_PEP_ID=MMETSP1086-20130531/52351_1 /TAXON_ID=77921 /ORGANISM="Cyanoptyche  gloeocystis , Strain SAG4.97" /LENGTH=603 /DNA_ID=CAMNT_0041999073 /DNA_START=111 /DNA_END=1922 /DNA_ORIENTATION=+
MSIKLINQYVGVPNTTRGIATFLHANPTNDSIVYPCGNSIVIRSLKDPLSADLYQAHTQPATVARFSPDGNWVVSADNVGNLKVWAAKDPEHAVKLEHRPVAGAILDLAWTSDGQKIVAVGDGKGSFGQVFNWDSGNQAGDIVGHSKKLTTCDFHPGPKPYKMATSGEDMKLNWYENLPLKFKHSTNEHTKFVNCIRFSPDGNLLLSGGSDSKMVMYDGNTGQPKGPLNSGATAHKGSIFSLSWSADSTRVLTGGGDKTAKIFDVNSGQAINTYEFNFRGTHEDMQVGSLWAGPFLLSLSLCGDLCYLDPRQPEIVALIQGHNKPIKCFAFDPPTKSCYTGSSDGIINAWTLGVGTASTFQGKGHTNSVTALAVAHDKLVSCSLDDTLRITSLDTKTYSADKVNLSAGRSISVFLRDSNKYVVTGQSSIILMKAGRPVSEIPAPYDPRMAEVSPDGATVAVAGGDNLVHLLSVSKDDRLVESATLDRHRNPLTCVAFSPDGAMLVSADQNRDVNLWSLKDKSLIHKDLAFHQARVLSIAWSPDGHRFATSSLDQSFIIWNIRNINDRLVQKGAHPGGVIGVSFVDPKTLLTVGNDLAIKTWSV